MGLHILTLVKSIKSSLDFIFLVLQNKTKICIFYFTVIHIVLKNLGILDIRTFTFSDEKKETQLLFRQYKNMRTYIGLTLFYWSSITFEPRGRCTSSSTVQGRHTCPDNPSPWYSPGDSSSPKPWHSDPLFSLPWKSKSNHSFWIAYSLPSIPSTENMILDTIWFFLITSK